MTRAALGQWFTAAPVAELALAALGPIDARARVLDPTCGDGAFLAAARARGLRTLTGLEIDRGAAAQARARLPGATIVDGDLLEPGIVERLGAFDVVIGNPPWVRAGRIDPAIKRARAALLRADWPELDRGAIDVVARLADIAATCLLRALRLLAPGGRLALVVSTALVNTDTAAPLWRLVERVARVRALIVAPGERWFEDAWVNPMLLVAESRTGTLSPFSTSKVRKEKASPIKSPELLGAANAEGESVPVRVLRLRAPTDVAARARGLDGIARQADERRATEPQGWGAALRAPRVWWDFAAAMGDALVPLRELAEIRRGVTTGANDVFYLRRAEATELGLERAFLAPVVRSPFNGSPAPIAIEPRETPLVALALPPEPKVLRGAPRIRAWLDRHADAATRSSVARRDPWWSIPMRPARLFLAKAYGPRFVQRLAKVPMLADQRVYALAPRAGVDLVALAAVLNALPTALALESLGRASLGYGAIEWTLRDALELPVVDVRRLDRDRLRAALAGFGRRPIEHVRLERARPERAALDRAVLAGHEGMIEPMWDALCASVALRDRYLLPAV